MAVSSQSADKSALISKLDSLQSSSEEADDGDDTYHQTPTKGNKNMNKQSTSPKRKRNADTDSDDRKLNQTPTKKRSTPKKSASTSDNFHDLSPKARYMSMIWDAGLASLKKDEVIAQVSLQNGETVLIES